MKSEGDALNYSAGPQICRVEIGGTIVRGNDKLAGTSRKVEWCIDGTALLCAFARWCAWQVIDEWDAPDVVKRFLMTGDASIRAAARDAAGAAARDAAGAAARDAAWAAAGAAAWAAARDAAGAAARDAAGAAAWAAARDAAGAAAGAAAWAAARDAAWDEQNTQLEQMVHEARDGRTEWIWE